MGLCAHALVNAVSVTEAALPVRSAKGLGSSMADHSCGAEPAAVGVKQEWDACCLCGAAAVFPRPQPGLSLVYSAGPQSLMAQSLVPVELDAPADTEIKEENWAVFCDPAEVARSLHPEGKTEGPLHRQLCSAFGLDAAAIRVPLPMPPPGALGERHMHQLVGAQIIWVQTITGWQGLLAAMLWGVACHCST